MIPEVNRFSEIRLWLVYVFFNAAEIDFIDHEAGFAYIELLVLRLFLSRLKIGAVCF